MKSNRRDFLKYSGVTGISLASASILPSAAGSVEKETDQEDRKLDHIRKQSQHKHKQIVNMSGYAAPRLDTVRIGFVGLGNRGSAAVERMSYIAGTSINGLCDIRSEQAQKAKDRIKKPGHHPTLFTEGPESWQKMCERDDIDLIYIATPWELHTPIALYAMEQGKHVATEIPAATTVENCWKLVETSEKTRKHCVMLENCCYDFFELLTLNMVRQGFFGEIIHGEGAYIHHILESLFQKDARYEYWRLRENTTRNGNLYPTHGFGPICQAMNINRGDRLEYMVSMSSDDFMMEAETKEFLAENPKNKQYVGPIFRGNMNSSTIRTAKGRTILVQHDVSSPRPYSRLHLLSGTKGTAQKYPLPGRISNNHEGWLDEQEMARIETQYTPPIVKKIGDVAKQVGGHGGMDFMMDWRLIDCLRNGLPVDIDVYDAATWSVIGPLSEWSVANRSQSIDIPDFTSGSWKQNVPVDLSLASGGNIL